MYYVAQVQFRIRISRLACLFLVTPSGETEARILFELILGRSFSIKRDGSVSCINFVTQNQFTKTVNMIIDFITKSMYYDWHFKLLARVGELFITCYVTIKTRVHVQTTCDQSFHQGVSKSRTLSD